MSAKQKLVWFSGIAILIQVIIWEDYVSPVQWGQVKINAQACTCPDANVINGSFYLWAITPDSLRKYDFDYTEIYMTERPATAIDIMGVDTYIIEGEIIGKKQVSETSYWNPVFRVDKYREVDFIAEWAVKFFLGIQVLIWLINWYDYLKELKNVNY